MEEKKSTVYEGNKQALIATILLIVLLFSASYAFFSNFNAANAKSKVAVGNMANITIAFTDKAEFSYELDPVEMQAACAETDVFGTDIIPSDYVIPTDYSYIALSATNGSGIDDVSCGFEVWYNPINPFMNSSTNKTGETEWFLHGAFYDSEYGVADNFDIDIGSITKPTKLFEKYINFNSEQNSIDYILETSVVNNIYCNGFDQSEQMGKRYSAVIQVKSTGCTDKTPTLSDTVIAKVSDSEYTSSQSSGGVYKVVRETVEYDGQTLDAGVRYKGKDPDNYVRFNNEYWRVIGVFEGNTIGLEPGKQYTKIIRETSIGHHFWDCGTFSFDSSYCDDSSFENDWANAWLKGYLNGEYYNTLSSKKQIAQFNNQYSLWYLKGASSEEQKSLTTSQWYITERYTGKPGYRDGVIYGADEEVRAAIGLMYPSDYGYAAYDDQDSCLYPANVDHWTDLNCADVDWLEQDVAQNSHWEWTITPASNTYFNTFGLTGGGIYHDIENIGDDNAARPTLYLEYDLKVVDGRGSKADPYVLN